MGIVKRTEKSAAYLRSLEVDAEMKEIRKDIKAGGPGRDHVVIPGHRRKAKQTIKKEGKK